ncbi:hypothetical protein SYYSPA8_10120 [Streptomyces yaizuensis]|uniref:PBS lyase n=1 Tax=Streptomyces yaizuensis TaxID=2989713 RepID=A0ABQ5NWY2_9ACTN|nr:hypothetical protein [Streptomyces sp. YSPA8]GLF94643.1 hypothetical protein SYYSPA8_10120 [Streptomyces sp. YSPA8]
MFGGIDEVDWATLGHAYGPADDVPELLRGLASADAVEREAALDGMYGAVHHQGDVYDSTLACIPFLLELVADPAVQDRGGIVELLTSIGGIDLDGDDELDPEDEEFEFAANYAMAASAVTAGADVFLGLLDAGDRGVRLTVPLALATLHSEPELVLGLLRDRLGAESDPEVRFACVEAAGRIALRHAWLAAEVVEWLVELARVRYATGSAADAAARRSPSLPGGPWEGRYAAEGWGVVDPWCVPGSPDLADLTDLTRLTDLWDRPPPGEPGHDRLPGDLYDPDDPYSPHQLYERPDGAGHRGGPDGLGVPGLAALWDTDPMDRTDSGDDTESDGEENDDGTAGGGDEPRATGPADSGPADIAPVDIGPADIAPVDIGPIGSGRPVLNALPSPGGPRDPIAGALPAYGSTRGDDPAGTPPGEAGGTPAGGVGRTDPARPAVYDAGLRLSALAQLARCAPHALPDDVVPGVTGLLRELRAEPADPPETGPLETGPSGAHGAHVSSGTYGSCAVYGTHADDDRTGTGPHALWTGDLLRTLHTGLGDRVADRTALLADQLCSPDRGQRIDAVRMSSALLRTRRGEYGELVALIGEQLADGEPRLADAAAAALGELFTLAAPAADALAEFAAADPGSWVQEWASGPRTLGAAVTALARAGDARAVPVLARILELPRAPHDLGYVLDHLGPAAAPLIPALRARLAGTELDDRLYDTAGPLLYGLTALGAAEALPEVLRVLRDAPEYRREWVVELALGALTAFGPAAREAAGELRALLADAGRPGGHAAAFTVKTAGALWAVAGDAGAVLPVLRATLVSESGARRAAAGVLGSMGPVAWEAEPELRIALRAGDPGTRVDAALALWRVTGDPEPGWPVLRAAWDALPFTRVPTAERLAEPSADAPGSVAADGPPVAGRAEGAEQLVRDELARVRRHNAMDGGYGSHDIVRDERLLGLCRRALTAPDSDADADAGKESGNGNGSGTVSGTGAEAGETGRAPDRTDRTGRRGNDGKAVRPGSAGKTGSNGSTGTSGKSGSTGRTRETGETGERPTS